MSIGFQGTDTFDQPLRDAWWTPGWTAQNPSYIPAGANAFAPQGFPPGLVYVNVMGNYFDLDANPLSGYLTFFPSSPVTISVNGGTTFLPQRYAGLNQNVLGLNQFGDGKNYLWYGQLNVKLLATDNSGMTPASFQYHVVEHFWEGSQYDIIVPSADASTTTGTDIHSLIIPGSIQPNNADIQENIPGVIRIAAISTQYIPVDITASAGGMGFNPTSFPVQFAFISGTREPQPSDWVSGSWAGINSPYVAQALVGPQGGTNLSAGSYQIWVQIQANPQVPVIQVGTLVIY
jgi:hypothetical protein